jgi:adenosylhomocysteinase
MEPITKGAMNMFLPASFEFERMRTTLAAVACSAKTLGDAGRALPNVVLCSHLEAKLAAWAVMLAEAGFKVRVCPSNPSSTVPSAAAALAERGIEVRHRLSADGPTAGFWEEMSAFGPDVVLDDGALLITELDQRGFDSLSGAVEFTTSGHASLSNGNGVRFPVMDVGLSFCKYELGNVFGTGISALVAISMAANVHLAAKRVLVVGYGAVGRSVAHAARSLGATVLVADPRLKNLARAHFEGNEVGALSDLARHADIVVTCALDAGTLSALPNNAIVANVGCFADEIDVAGLRAQVASSVKRDRQLETFWLPDGRSVHVLANAELVNLAIGRGWPIELIDICFALSTLCFAEICTGELNPGLQPVGADLENAALELFLAELAGDGA